jgi:hypothetical protein
MKYEGNDFSVQANVSAANVKGRRPGRNQKIIDRV